MAMRSAEPETNRPIRDTLRRLIKAPAALSILWPALLIVGGYVTWHRWGSEHVAQNYYGIDVAQIHITQPPSYVRSDIIQSVYRDTAMDGLSLMDKQATAKIASAFSMHPWVQSVTSVRKLPGGVVDVRMDYRRPVAMVQVFRTVDGIRDKFFFPIDGHAVLLPTGEFTRSETLEFVHIDVPGADSTNAEGMPFGDPRVEAAARLAEVLLPVYREVGIRKITVVGDPRQIQVPQLEVTTDNDTRHHWGSPPGLEIPGERTAEMKLRALMAVRGNTPIDLRVATMADPGHS
ncbi:Cell division protein FtsQ [Rubripirellula lacrimiformis]|uniref:Cell division protein FtsQ n=1 Tax=Rubripirellula lacrimiformis TaxID=1930273 RepID=A0A517NI17_9BACT|nr:hypothetical protein [Rubripirellula lacrimiformis]QDT06780.1 Cell division protein FtsQ [Rubripirellula lacrimiformis]